MLEVLINFAKSTGIYDFIEDPVLAGKTLLMYVIIGVLIYLAIGKKYEPLLLLPIAFGMLLANLPGAELFHMEYFLREELNYSEILHGGLVDILYLGVKLGIYPSLIFLGVGAMTDFSSPDCKSEEPAARRCAHSSACSPHSSVRFCSGLHAEAAAAIGIIGGADGPTAILVTKTLAPQLLGPIAIAAYSYMALIPIIQPPFMKLLTTKKERSIVMGQLAPRFQDREDRLPDRGYRFWLPCSFPTQRRWSAS